MALNQLLFNIDSYLGQDDFESLKFLCMDLIPFKKLEKMQSCLHLFDELQKSGDLSEDDYSILAELLYLIGQHSLLRMLKTNRNAVKETLREKKYVSMYRRMLFELSENTTKEDQNSITYLLNIPNKFKENKSFLEILFYLDKTGNISEDNVDILENVVGEVSQELLNKIKTYKKETATTTLELLENANLPVSDPPLSIQAVSSTDTEYNNIESLREHVEVIHEVPSETDVEAENYISPLSLHEESKSEVYPMNRKHRGYCVIINNSEFIRSNSRPGTEKDAEELDKVFTWLGFDVVVYNEQKAKQICNIMEDFQMKDHSDRDCFVCCILTHGQSKAIFGTDNEPVNIKSSIVSPFSPSKCKSLAGKPKLFFIQACQGKSEQGSHFIEEDAVVTTNTIPEEADVLIGMSTVDGYISYRHIENGTWYIQALCANLEKMVPK
ncbi:caspase-10-like isoform X2 [Pyxicephalus adspersus]